MRIVFVTGMSGAGRSTAARALEDEGYHVMDNLPPSLIIDAAKLLSSRISQAAVVLDVRGGAIEEAIAAVTILKDSDFDISTLFLDAENVELVHRFEGSRRPHPLQTSTGLLAAINAERELLANLRADADLIIDSTGLSPHDLRNKIAAAFSNPEQVQVTISLVSFGFKRGTPIDADFVFDARFLPNPHWIPELRPLSGLDAEVNDYLMGSDLAITYLEAMQRIVEIAVSGYLADGKRYLTVAIGCTGGRHRSVALAENLAARLVRDGVETFVLHRDCDRE
jgi:RNase adapter protein RapZ